MIGSPIVSLKNLVRYNRVLRAAATLLMVRRKFPAVLGIDTASTCNLDCSFCGPRKMTAPHGIMSRELFSKIIDECARHPKLWMLILHNFGEPLMNPGIAAMISEAKKRAVARSIQFSTNGVLLTESLARDLIESGLDGIVFSVDAATRSEYAALKGRDMLDIVEANARMFMSTRKRLKSRFPRVSAKMVSQRGNSAACSEFVNKWRGIVDEVAVTPFSNWGNTIRYNGTDTAQRERYACHFLWYYPILSWDGKVYFCCAVCAQDGVVGDIGQETLAAIWQGPRMKAVRQAHLAKQFDTCVSCAKCSYWSESGSNLDYFLRS